MQNFFSHRRDRDTRQSASGAHWTGWGLFLLALLAFNFAFRLIYARFEFLLNPDDALWALTAREFLHGKMLYRDVWLDKPPGATLVCAALFKFFGVRMIALRLFAPVYVFVTSLCVAEIAREVYGKWSSAVATAFVYSWLTVNFFPEDMMLFNTELLMALPYALAVLLLFRGRWFASGVLTGVAILFKPVAAANLIFVAAMVLANIVALRRSGLEEEHHKTKRRELVTGFVLACTGTLVVLNLFVIWLAANGALHPFWHDAIELGAHYVGAQTWSETFRRSYALLVYGFWNSPFLLFAFWMMTRSFRGGLQVAKPLELPRHLVEEQRRDNADWFVALWFIASFIGVAAGRRFYGHYFIQLLPPFALLATRGLERFVEVVREQRTLALRAALAVWIAAVVAAGYRFHDRTVQLSMEYLKDPQKPPSSTWLLTNFNRDMRELGEYLDAHTQADDAVFVWGYKPEVYLAAERPLASRYLSYVPLTGWAHGMPDIDFSTQPEWQTNRAHLIDELEVSRPKYIVDMGVQHDFGMHHPITRYPDLSIYVSRHYAPEITLGTSDNTAIFYRRKD